FKRAVNRSRVLRLYRENMAFVKPSETRREQREERLRQSRKYSRSR
ncbi:MAG: 30S ribosomal protein S21, partial [Rhodothermales bacterium]|nr:30S ribosomal protein S21 [Rhodothermales bacterium]